MGKAMQFLVFMTTVSQVMHAMYTFTSESISIVSAVALTLKAVRCVDASGIPAASVNV